MIEEATVHRELVRLGCRTSYKGFNYLQEAVMLAYGDSGALTNMEAAVYPKIAAKYGVNRKTAESDIRTVIANCDLPAFKRQAVYAFDGKPTVKTFIANVVELLKYNCDG